MSMFRSLLIVSVACLILSILTFQTVNGSPMPEANPEPYRGGHYGGGHHGGGHYGGGHHGGGHYGGGHHRGGGSHWG